MCGRMLWVVYELKAVFCFWMLEMKMKQNYLRSFILNNFYIIKIVSFLYFIPICIGFILGLLAIPKILATDKSSSALNSKVDLKIEQNNKFKDFELYGVEGNKVNMFMELEKLFIDLETTQKQSEHKASKSMSEDERISLELERLRKIEEQKRKEEQEKQKIQEQQWLKEQNQQILNYEKIRSQYADDIKREIQQLPVITEDEINWNGLDD